MTDSCKLGALQFDVQLELEANLQVVEAGLRQAQRSGLSLVLLPELWATSFFGACTFAQLERQLEDNARAAEALSRWTLELGLAAGGSLLFPGESGEAPRNRLRIFEHGREVLWQDKLHLFSPTAEDESFSAGRELPRAVQVAGLRTLGLVCYDLRFGPACARASSEAAQVLLLPAQWPDTRATHWRALVCGRAVEQQCFVLAANRTGSARVGRRQMQLDFPGNSLLVDPHGRILAEGQGQAGLVWAAIQPRQVEQLRIQVPVHKDRRADLY